MKISFTPKKGGARKGTFVRKDTIHHGKVWVLLEGDPFPVRVDEEQVQTCNDSEDKVPSSGKVPKDRENERRQAVTTAPSAKQLRVEAKNLGVENWQEMGRDELAKAIEKQKSKSKAKKAKGSTPSKPKAKASKPKPSKPKPAAKKAAPKKAPAKKAAASKAASKPAAQATSDNPFRKGSALHIITPLLIKGGKRKVLAERLSKKVVIHPYSDRQVEIDLKDYDKRITLAADQLKKNHGFTVEKVGRGMNGTIKATPPKAKKK